MKELKEQTWDYDSLLNLLFRMHVFTMDCKKKKTQSIKVPNMIMDPVKVPSLLDVEGKNPTCST